MGIIEQKLLALKEYKPELTREADFSYFWEIAMQEVFPHGQNEQYPVSYELGLENCLYPIEKVKVYKASLQASDGTVLRGWYLCPADAGPGKVVPGLVRFHGYSSNKGKISELLLWALQGYAILAMDIRGQCGDTPDARVYSSGAFSGWLTRGLDSPIEYYYRQVYLDSVQLIEALARRKEVDPLKIGLFGNSQGGAVATISAALLNHFTPKIECITARIKAVNAGIPFLSDMQKAYKEHTDGPWMEFDWYFRMHDPFHEREDAIFQCLSYFDAMNFAPWVKCSVLMSVGLKDTACPPPTVFALYNHLGCEKEIIPYADYGHETIDDHVDRQIHFFAQNLLK